MKRTLRSFRAAAFTAGVTLALAVGITTVPAHAQLSSASSLGSTGSAAALSSADVAQELQGSSAALAEAIGSGDMDRRTLRVDGREREYLLALPQNFDPVRTYTVILGFGGWQHSASGMRSYADLERTAGDAIVVYAQGVDNAWAGAPYAATSLSEDINYVSAIIDELVADYSARRSEVYAVGMSNGGGMAVALACHAPQLVTAVATVAGAPYDPTVTGCAAGQVPALIIHGTADDVIAYTGGTRHGAPYHSVDQTFGVLGNRNGCDMTALTSVDEANTTTFTPRDCDVATEVVRVNGGGHTWFVQPDATTLTVDFFERF